MATYSPISSAVAYASDLLSYVKGSAGCRASQAASRADVGAQPLVALLLILPQLCTLEEVDAVQILVAALLILLQLSLNLHSACSYQCPVALEHSPRAIDFETRA